MSRQQMKTFSLRALACVVVLGGATVQAFPGHSGQTPAAAGAKAGPSIQATLAELAKTFTVRGKPVHPGLIAKFERQVSDPSNPAVLSVDALAAAGSNEYFDGDVKMDPNLGATITQDQGSFSYKWLGTVAPNVHVVKAFASTGGSGVFETLFVLRATAGVGQSQDGPYDQLLLSVTQFFVLGDRDDGTVTVQPNTITIGKSRYRDKPVTLSVK